MRLSEIMTDSVEVIDPESSLREAARKMKKADVGALPVCDGQKIVGIVTDRDIAVRAVAEGEDPDTCKVSDVMSTGVAWCYDDQDISEAGRMMQERQIRRLIVVDRSKQLKGIVSLGDLAVKGENESFYGEVLERVSEPSHPVH